MQSVVTVAQGVGGIPAVAGGDAAGSPRLAAVALASVALLILGAGLLWFAHADTVFLDIVSAGLPGCF